MNLLKSFRNAAVAVMLFSAGVANATLQFTLTGNYSASWQLNPTITSDYSVDGVGFLLFDVEGNFPRSMFDVADLTFYHGDVGGGLEIYDYYGDLELLLTDGPQLYSGPESSPTFNLGTFSLTDFNGTGRYTLTVTDLDAPPAGTDVPEPASAAILLGGLGLMACLRKRHQAK